jgi:lysophospholipase L1-like esterase
MQGYNDPFKAWWEYLEENLNIPVTVAGLGQAGSGYVRRGIGRVDGQGVPCRGTTFEERLPNLEALADAGLNPAPSILIIAGGNNDRNICTGNPDQPVRPATKVEIENRIRSYFYALEPVIAKLGIPRGRVYIFTPWGHIDEPDDDRRIVVQPILEKVVNDGPGWPPPNTIPEWGIFFTMAMTPADMTQADGFHPNCAGQRLIFQKFKDRSNFDERFATKFSPITIPACG